MSANSLLAADAGAFCAKHEEFRSRVAERQEEVMDEETLVAHGVLTNGGFLILTRLNIKTGNTTYLSCYLTESELVIILICWRQRHIPSTAKKENYASHINGGCPDSALGGRVPAHPLHSGGYPEELIPGPLRSAGGGLKVV
jgi:hypothetical protein